MRACTAAMSGCEGGMGGRVSRGAPHVPRPPCCFSCVLSGVMPHCAHMSHQGQVVTHGCRASHGGCSAHDGACAAAPCGQRGCMLVCLRAASADALQLASRYSCAQGADTDSKIGAAGYRRGMGVSPLWHKGTSPATIAASGTVVMTCGVTILPITRPVET